MCLYRTLCTPLNPHLTHRPAAASPQCQEMIHEAKSGAAAAVADGKVSLGEFCAMNGVEKRGGSGGGGGAVEVS